MSTQRNIDENVRVEDGREDVEYEHACDDENEDLVYEREDDYSEHVDVVREHESVCNEHEIVDDKNENVDNEHDDVDDDHEYNIHKHIQFDNDDLSCIVERVADVKIDFDFTDSDDDDDDVDDIDNIDDDQCYDQRAGKNTDNNKEKITQSSDSFVHDNLRSPAKKVSLSDNERQKLKSSSNASSNQSKNRTAKLLEIDSKAPSVKYSCDSPSVHQGNTSLDQKYEHTDLPVKNVHTNELEDKEITKKKEHVKSEDNHVNSDGSSQFVFGNGSEKEQLRKFSVYKVYQVLLEWCTSETEKYLTKSLGSKEGDDRKETEKATERRSKRKDDGKSLQLPSIDSKSQMAIRGKIVSEKLTKA